MRIHSDFEKDIRQAGKPSGGYEWWYFDGWDESNNIGFVIIFYDGNPFSTKYLREFYKNPLPESFPAVSISVYKGDKPLYYSFTEFSAADAEFGESEVCGRIGGHSFRAERKEGILCYQLKLSEELASGDKFNADILFKSSNPPAGILTDETARTGENHIWNLVQPKAEVSGVFIINGAKENFEGSGYHDHNCGAEQLDESFIDWYWGRVHFRNFTLIYYLMNKHDGHSFNGWIFDRENRVINTLNDIELEHMASNLFRLKSSRVINLTLGQGQALIQAGKVLDNGPFYQRFRSTCILNLNGEDEAGTGISEYLKPGRIKSKIFWPLIHMRIRYITEKPHWVQKSKKLYRWTW